MKDGDETYADATCPIATFDVRPSQTQTQATEGEVPSADHEGKGYKKSTIKAMRESDDRLSENVRVYSVWS